MPISKDMGPVDMGSYGDKVGALYVDLLVTVSAVADGKLDEDNNNTGCLSFKRQEMSLNCWREKSYFLFCLDHTGK